MCLFDFEPFIGSHNIRLGTELTTLVNLRRSEFALGGKSVKGSEKSVVIHKSSGAQG